MSAPDDLASVFLHRFEQGGVRYAATGGYAAIVYGEPRLTVDVDVVVDLHPAAVGRLVDAFDAADYYVPPADVMAEELQRAAFGHFNLLHTSRGCGPTSTRWVRARSTRGCSTRGVVWNSRADRSGSHLPST